MFRLFLRIKNKFLIYRAEKTFIKLSLNVGLNCKINTNNNTFIKTITFETIENHQFVRPVDKEASELIFDDYKERKEKCEFVDEVVYLRSIFTIIDDKIIFTFFSWNVRTPFMHLGDLLKDISSNTYAAKVNFA